ncbi:MAG: hypothetical protein NT075_02675 [Chloroflexi bacterium]|nr:hypothetical protein [Chloroflexota bacterium]
MNLVKLIFSYDRPLQLWGLVRSLLDNSDLAPAQIHCICKSSTLSFRQAYAVVGRELGCQIVHENRLLPGVDIRRLLKLASHPGLRRRLNTGLNSLNRHALLELIRIHAAPVDYVSLAVDDMVYFQHANFAHATKVLGAHPAICLWSWRIGEDLQNGPVQIATENYWTIAHATAPLPYSYIFHTDGSVFRKTDLLNWLDLLPVATQNSLTLNVIEGKLAEYSELHRTDLPIGPLHAGPMQQGCITWQLNRVTLSSSTAYTKTELTDPYHLLRLFRSGTRLNYRPLYNRTDWIIALNKASAVNPTHVAPNPQAVAVWSQALVSG